MTSLTLPTVAIRVWTRPLVPRLALLEHQPLFGQRGIDRLEDHAGQVSLLPQAAEREQGVASGADTWLRSILTKRRPEKLSYLATYHFYGNH